MSNKYLQQFISPACLRSTCAENQERRASWMELFYDLVFMVAIAAMAEMLYTHNSWLGIAEFILLFISLWCAWTANTFYATRFDTDDPYHRIMFLAQMFCIAFVAVFSEKTFATQSQYFAIAYSALCIIIIALYTRICIALPKIRPIIKKLLLGICCSTSFWIISIFIPTPWRFLFWVIALVIFLITPTLIRNTLEQSHAALSASHLPERFALFTILVLGEAIANVIYGVEFHGLTQISVFTAIMSMILAFGIWWLYFENIEIDLSKLPFMTVIKWESSHLLLVLAITMLSVGIRYSIENDLTIKVISANILGIATALIFLTIGLLQNIKNYKEKHYYIIFAILGYILGLSATFYHASLAIAGLVILTIVQIAIYYFPTSSTKTFNNK